jgi:spore coat protein U domain-containing protein, fimbrial subunit CupE1/2/3/6
MNTGARKTHSRDQSRFILTLVVITGLAGVILASTPVAATTVTNTFTVQAVINSSCNVTATTLNFGAYDPTSATALNGSSTVSVFCTSGTPYTTTLNVGSGGGSFVTRTIANGGNTLNYNLYRDSARSQVWGDGSGSTFTVAGTGSGLLTASTLTVYGDIATAQDKPPGTYTSTITVTVTY